MTFWLIIALLQFLVPILLIGAIVVFFRKRKGGAAGRGISVSSEDNLSQLYLVVATAFFGVTLMSVSRDFGDLLRPDTALLLACIAGLALGYFVRAIYLIPLSLVGLVIWWVIRAGSWLDGTEVRTAALLAGPFLLFLLMYVLGRIQEHSASWKRFGWSYVALSLLSVTGILFVISTSVGLELFASLFEGEPFFAVWQVAASLLVFVLALLFTAVYALGKHELSTWEAGGIVLFVALMLVLVFIPPQDGFYVPGGEYRHYATELGPAGYVWGVVINLVLLLELLGILFAGYYRREEWLVNFAMISLFLFILIKYFDWFSTMLDRSVFFTLAGIILIGLGWSMERGRRYMLRSMAAAPQLP